MNATEQRTYDNLVKLFPEDQDFEVALCNLPENFFDADGPIGKVVELSGGDPHAVPVKSSLTQWSLPTRMWLELMAAQVAQAFVASHEWSVRTKTKSPEDILGELCRDKKKVAAAHMASCIPGEAGELFDAVKGYIFYDKRPDIENVIEELGDLEFYMEGLRQLFNISREETLVHNRFKLDKRYKEGKFSNAAAQARADKEEDLHDDDPFRDDDDDDDSPAVSSYPQTKKKKAFKRSAKRGSF